MGASIVSSGPDGQWVAGPEPLAGHEVSKAYVRVTADSGRPLRGFGGSFNELGMAALLSLPAAERDRAADWLFSPAEGCGLALGRIPIGANDFALDWYSCDESEGDFRMERFSIERDRRLVIPFIRLAQSRMPGMRFLASPWSPPTWMKEPPVLNRGSLREGSEYRNAYALYLARFVEAYAAEDVPIDIVFVQNEPNSEHPFPCCLWKPDAMRDFISGSLAPLFSARGIGAEIWLGTMEKGDAVGWDRKDGVSGRSDWRDWVWASFSRPEALAYLKGIGFQWDGKAAMQRTRAAFPDLPIIGTECECGDGSNTWAHAHYVFDLMWSYFQSGAEAFMHWNLVLGTPGRSTWGWAQNSLLSVAEDGQGVVRNPEYWLMRHVSAPVPAGSRPRGVMGPWAAFTLAFERPDGGLVAVVANPDRERRTLSLDLGRELLSCELPPYSFSTIVPAGPLAGPAREAR